MFERFTKEARAAVVGAQDVAREAGARSIDTRHLLVALLERPGPALHALRAIEVDVEAVLAQARADVRAGGIDADALAGIGIDLDAVRRQADAVFGPDALERAGRKSAGHIPFTTDAKKALELALREAIRLKHKRLGGSHLMLGILRAKSPGRALLEHTGVDTDAFRTALEEQPKAA
ncbi:Clp protease N-terminal domain-containing protein [Nocardioides sp.]|uniref:Clp protease N-terminal domain-containing protein n=1 Tax=Nocardioides sp. TaxID=35761 RepID=UPI002ED69EF9